LGFASAERRTESGLQGVRRKNCGAMRQKIDSFWTGLLPQVKNGYEILNHNWNLSPLSGSMLLLLARKKNVAPKIGS
jgi:hypothetical protein